MTIAFPVGLIAVVLCIIPSYASDTCPGCLYGYYAKVKEFGSLGVSDAPEFDPPVKAVNFSVTPLGVCKVTFVMFNNKIIKWGYFSAFYTMTDDDYGSTLDLYSVEEYRPNAEKDVVDNTKVVLMAWKERPSLKGRLTGYQLEAVRNKGR